MDYIDKSRRKNPRDDANVFSKFCSYWIFKVLKESYGQKIGIDNLWELPETYQEDKYSDALQMAWDYEMSKEATLNTKKKPSLLKALTKVYGPKYLLIIVEAVVAQIPNLLRPMFISTILLYFNGIVDETTAAWNVVGLMVSMCFYIVIFRHKSSSAFNLGIMVQRDVIMLIYKKSLKLSATSLSQATPGQIVNMASNDTARFANTLDTATNLVTAPIVMIIITAYVYFLLGIPALIGFVIVIILIPIEYGICGLAKKFRLKVARQTDQRVKLMNEIIHGIQVIKMYAWEKPFIKIVTEIRKRELRNLRGAFLVRGLYMLILVAFSRGYIYIVLALYIFTGSYVTSYLVFITSIYSYLISNSGVSATLKAFIDLGELSTSIKRLQKLLSLDEYNGHGTNNKMVDNNTGGTVINFDSVFAKWSPTDDMYTLNKISLSIFKGELVGIFGSVGSGKSSLLEALLGELSIQSGHVSVGGTLSYASQDAWIFPASVRQNILFGQQYDTVKYNNVVKACSLMYDLQAFRYGDQTLVGENGALLSGGQRARINLARAIYKDADIYLLDDPLSAVDAHVGNRILEDCVKGYIKDKTCLIATHQLQFMHLMDKIIVVHEGKIEFFGTYEELQQSGIDCQTVLEDSSVEDEDQTEEVVVLDHPDIPIENHIDQLGRSAKTMTIRRSRRVNGRSKSVCSYTDGTNVNEHFAFQKEENESSNYTGSKIFWLYAKSGTSVFVIILIAIFCIYAQICMTAIEFFLSIWIKDEKNFLGSLHYDVLPVPRENSTFEFAIHHQIFLFDSFVDFNLTYLYVYTGIILNAMILLIIKMFLLSIIVGNASKITHNSVLQSVLNAPYVFFTENNSGRLLNRFSNDLGDLDEALPSNLVDYIQIAVEITAGLILGCIINPPTIILVLLVVICLYLIQKNFLPAFKNLREAEGLSRSPVFSYLNSTLQGLNTIHCTQINRTLEREFKKHLDLNTSSKYLITESTCAFVGLVDIVMMIFYLSIVLAFFFFDPDDGVGSGMVVANLMRVITLTELCLKLSMDIWYKISAFERLSHYNNIEPEKQPTFEDAEKVSPEWPLDGKIEFINVSLRYKPNQPAVLKGINITIKPREKIGIVGRTGAGKSSIVSALFRLAQIEGTIKLDGIDTAKLRLDTLRSKISIIPQSPTLFSGTLRSNLDPFSEKEDYILINALSEVGMFEKLIHLNGLNMTIAEAGNNFSVGERQLICLARAIIKQNTILIMDEATANIDSRTDRQIQNVIKRKFERCTILTIAHRLHTVMRSDKILVMDAGQVEEYGCPYELLNRPDGKLRKLVDETGPETSKYLKQEAKMAYLEAYSV